MTDTRAEVSFQINMWWTRTAKETNEVMFWKQQQQQQQKYDTFMCVCYDASIWYQSFVECYVKHLVLGRGRKLCSPDTEAFLQVT
jgi:hypothetical protein